MRLQTLQLPHFDLGFPSLCLVWALLATQRQMKWNGNEQGPREGTGKRVERNRITPGPTPSWSGNANMLMRCLCLSLLAVALPRGVSYSPLLLCRLQQQSSFSLSPFHDESKKRSVRCDGAQAYPPGCFAELMHGIRSVTARLRPVSPPGPDVLP